MISAIRRCSASPARSRARLASLAVSHLYRHYGAERGRRSRDYSALGYVSHLDVSFGNVYRSSRGRAAGVLPARLAFWPSCPSSLGSAFRAAG
jgi:hypothetical protein